MVLLTKSNVTVELLESICSEDGGPFLLQTPLGVLQFRLAPTTNTRGKHTYGAGMLMVRAQHAYILFSDARDTLLHGTPEELVDYIKEDNYYLELPEVHHG